jgi:hypothetical protein
MNKDHEEIMQTYGFSYTDCEGKVYKKEISTPGASWHECMDDYVKFLETIFGYPIKHQVRLEEPMYLKSMYENYPSYIDPWTGEYFKPEETNDTEFWWDKE